MATKTLKIIAIISFLLICSIDQKGFPISTILIIYSFVSFQELFNSGNLNDILWEGIILPILISGTLITFYKCRENKDKYIQLLCFIVLLLSIVNLTGICNPNNYFKPNLPVSFILPTSIFVISSIILIVLAFNKKKD